MKKLIFIALLLTGCQPTQSEIDEAANRQLELKLACIRIGVSVDGTGELIRENQEYLCVVNSKNLKSHYVFYEKEIYAIRKFLFMTTKGLK